MAPPQTPCFWSPRSLLTLSPTPPSAWASSCVASSCAGSPQRWRPRARERAERDPLGSPPWGWGTCRGGRGCCPTTWVEEPISSSTCLGSLTALGSLCPICHQHNQHHQALTLGVVLFLGPKGKVLSIRHMNKKRSRAIHPQTKDIFNTGKERQAGDGTTRPELQKLQMGFGSRALSLALKPSPSQQRPQVRLGESCQDFWKPQLVSSCFPVEQAACHSIWLALIPVTRSPKRPSTKISAWLASSHAQGGRTVWDAGIWANSPSECSTALILHTGYKVL